MKNLISFSDQVVKNLFRSLPEPVCERRRELLPQILDEWSRTDLQKHLSLDTRAVTKRRIKKVERVRDCARALLMALNAADEERATIEDEMLRRVEGRSLDDISRLEWSNMSARLDEEVKFLTKLAAIAPEGWWRLGPGQPRNYAGYLVLSDAASIFLWFTHRKPKREVDRNISTETGPFFWFASVLWPLVFGKGIHGLPATMKNWEKVGSRCSPLVANIDVHHPTWRVYEC